MIRFLRPRPPEGANTSASLPCLPAAANRHDNQSASPADALDAYLDHLRKIPEPEVPFDLAWLIDDIENTRLRGYSIDDEEDSLGVRCIGSAIMAGNREPIFAVSITGPSGRFTTERAHACAPALMAATANLSNAYGWSVETNKQ